MMYDEGTGLVKLSTPNGKNSQMWVIEEDDEVGWHIGHKIRNVGANQYLAAEWNGQQVTVTPDKGTWDDNNTWIFPGRPQRDNEFITHIKSAVNGNLLANNGHFIVTDTNGQKWRFVIAD